MWIVVEAECLFDGLLQGWIRQALWFCDRQETSCQEHWRRTGELQLFRNWRLIVIGRCYFRVSLSISSVKKVTNLVRVKGWTRRMPKVTTVECWSVFMIGLWESSLHLEKVWLWFTKCINKMFETFVMFLLSFLSSFFSLYLCNGGLGVKHQVTYVLYLSLFVLEKLLIYSLAVLFFLLLSFSLPPFPLSTKLTCHIWHCRL